MKIAITGHCDGIGKAIYDKLTDKGHELIGFDIADGSGDILNGRKEIIEKSKDCDVFINNAFNLEGAQTDMFNDIYELWKDERKQLINICSASKHYPSIFNSGLHFNYIAALMNDLFGIQGRAGCSCMYCILYIILQN